MLYRQVRSGLLRYILCRLTGTDRWHGRNSVNLTGKHGTSGRRNYLTMHEFAARLTFPMSNTTV